MIQANLTVYGVGTLRAMRAHWVMAELGLTYHTEQVQSRTGQTKTDAYTKLDPRQKIPVLRDGEFVLSESTAIVTYLAETYGLPGRELVPTDRRERARYNEWISFISMELDATTLYVLRRHEGLADVYGAAPVASQVARAYFEKMIGAAAARYGVDQAYLLGDVFSGADIIMMTCLVWAKRYGIGLPQVFEAYHDRIAGRDTYQAAMIANTPAGADEP